MKLWSHTLSSTTPEKKNARFLGSAFCFDILSFYFSLRQHGLGCQPQMAFEFKHAYVRHLLWLSIFFFFTTTHFFLELLLKLLCMVSNVLPSVSVWVCSIINMEGGERMNMWRECTALSFPLLFFPVFHLSFFSSPGQSVCLSLPVCESTLSPAFLPSLLQTPTYFCPPHHNGAVVG